MDILSSWYLLYFFQMQLYIRNQGCADLISNVVVFPCCLDVSLIMVINLLLFGSIFLTHSFEIMF